MWQFDPKVVIFHRCSIVTKSVSPAILGIMGPKYIGVMTFTFLGHVTIWFAICHFLLAFIGTELLSPAVVEIRICNWERGIHSLVGYNCRFSTQMELTVSVNVCRLQLICKCLYSLKPDNFNLILMSQKFAHESGCNRQEYWYKTRYGVEGIAVAVWISCCAMTFITFTTSHLQSSSSIPNPVNNSSQLIGFQDLKILKIVFLSNNYLSMTSEQIIKCRLLFTFWKLYHTVGFTNTDVQDAAWSCAVLSVTLLAYSRTSASVGPARPIHVMLWTRTQLGDGHSTSLVHSSVTSCLWNWDWQATLLVLAHQSKQICLCLIESQRMWTLMTFCSCVPGTNTLSHLFTSLLDGSSFSVVTISVTCIYVKNLPV